MRTLIKRTCIHCGRLFQVTPNAVKQGRGLNCSKACQSASHRGSGNPAWNGGHTLLWNGEYRGVRTDDERRYVLEHVFIAEKALGKPLPPGAIVHHHDQNKLNNRSGNLVICQDRGYHAHIHARMRVVKAGRDPDLFKHCSACKEPRPRDMFYKNKSQLDGLNNTCKACVDLSDRLRYYLSLRART